MASIKHVPQFDGELMRSLFDAIASACHMEASDERTALVKALTDTLLYLANPALIVEFDKH